MTRNSTKKEDLCTSYEDVICSDSLKKAYLWYFRLNKNLSWKYYSNILQEIVKYVKWENNNLKLSELYNLIELFNHKNFKEYINSMPFEEVDEENSFTENLTINWIMEYITWLCDWFIKNKMKEELINVLNDGTPTESFNTKIYSYNWKKLITLEIEWFIRYYLIDEKNDQILWEYDKVWEIQEWYDKDKVFKAYIWGKKGYVSLSTWKLIWWEFDAVSDIFESESWYKMFKATIWYEIKNISLMTFDDYRRGIIGE